MARTINQIKAAMDARGSHWFDPETIEHWNTVAYPAVHSAGKAAGQYFVTSERDDNDGEGGKTMFTVRRYDPATVKIDYAPGHTFKEFATHAEAELASIRAAEGERRELANKAAREKRADIQKSKKEN